VRTNTGSIEERLQAASQLLNSRIANLPSEKAAVEAAVSSVWKTQFLNLAPGALVLEKTMKRYGVGFSKEKGDSERLARHVRPEAVPSDLKQILKEVSYDDRQVATKAATN